MTEGAPDTLDPESPDPGDVQRTLVGAPKDDSGQPEESRTSASGALGAAPTAGPEMPAADAAMGTWPAVPSASAFPGRPEAFRRALESFRVRLEERRSDIERERARDAIAPEEYGVLMDGYQRRIDAYHEGIETYREIVGGTQ
jgi:hypothetical protein